MDMNNLIGRRFTLISKSDIRYIGTLHQINPEDTSIGLENVISYGTEGRREDPADEIPPADNVFEYIIFRQSDVNEIFLIGEEARTVPTSIPDDPAIIGSSRPRAPPLTTGSSAAARQFPAADARGPVPPNISRSPVSPEQPQQPADPGDVAALQRFGPPVVRPIPSVPVSPEGPGWLPLNDPYAGRPFPPMLQVQFPCGTRVMHPGPRIRPRNQVGLRSPRASRTRFVDSPPPDVTRAAPSRQASLRRALATAAAPPVPVPAPAAAAASTLIRVHSPFSVPASSIRTVTRVANNLRREADRTAAAAASNEPPTPFGVTFQRTDATADAVTGRAEESDAIDLHRRDDQQGGVWRGGRWRAAAAAENRRGTHTIDVPDADYDFASANARFNKQDIAVEAGIAGSLNANASSAAETLQQDQAAPTRAGMPPIVPYNKASFFDNISSETRDRVEGTSIRRREWLGQERRRNLEAFGQGRVAGRRQYYYRSHRVRGYGNRDGGHADSFGGGDGRQVGAPRRDDGGEDVAPAASDPPPSSQS